MDRLMTLPSGSPCNKRGSRKALKFAATNVSKHEIQHGAGCFQFYTENPQQQYQR
jgi:hypothetical protein